MGFETVEPPEVVYPVVDCPDHPCSALQMPSGRVFCLACGLEVHAPDPIMGQGWTGEAPAELKAEAREAWNGSRAIRDFAASCQPGTTPLRR